MGLGRICIKLQRLLARTLRCFQILHVPSPSKEINIRVGQAGPGCSESGIDLDCPLEHLSSELHALARPLMIKLASAKIKFVRLDIGCGGFEKADFFSFREREA